VSDIRLHVKKRVVKNLRPAASGGVPAQSQSRATGFGPEVPRIFASFFHHHFPYFLRLDVSPQKSEFGRSSDKVVRSQIFGGRGPISKKIGKNFVHSQKKVPKSGKKGKRGLANP